MLIRKEEAEDYESIYSVVKQAFESAEHSDGNEQDLVDKLRQGEAYGAQGRDFIEVHHKKPLHTLDETVIINPETDLVCLCSNCHRMIHRKRNQVLSVEELKSIYKDNLNRKKN